MYVQCSNISCKDTNNISNSKGYKEKSEEDPLPTFSLLRGRKSKKVLLSFETKNKLVFIL